MAAASAASNTAASKDIVLITGASRGIGVGLVERFAEAGHTVIATARAPAKAPALEAVRAKYPKLVYALQLDVDDAKSVSSLPARIAEVKTAADAVKLDRIDVVVNNSGIQSSLGGTETLETVTREMWVKVFTTNTIGAWDVTRVLLPLLRRSATPRVINVSSTMGSVAFINSAAMMVGRAGSYRVSKTALNGLSALQSAEYNEASVAARAKGGAEAAAAAPIVTVITVCPGPVDTDMASEFRATLGAVSMPFKGNSVAASTAGLYKIVADAKVKPNAQAQYLSWEGESSTTDTPFQKGGKLLW